MGKSVNHRGKQSHGANKLKEKQENIHKHWKHGKSMGRSQVQTKRS